MYSVSMPQFRIVEQSFFNMLSTKNIGFFVYSSNLLISNSWKFFSYSLELPALASTILATFSTSLFLTILR